MQKYVEREKSFADLCRPVNPSWTGENGETGETGHVKLDWKYKNFPRIGLELGWNGMQTRGLDPDCQTGGLYPDPQSN